MSTLIVLEDGRILGVSNGEFDGILEAVAEELNRDADSVSEMAIWLLEQRCRIQGPGVGYLDVRELSPTTSQQFRTACRSIHRRQQEESPDDEHRVPEWLVGLFRELSDMWAAIERHEPPESLTSPYWKIHPASGDRVGPGW